MKLTKIQWATIIALIAYIVYEFYFVAQWERGLPESDPVIRADLIFIYPVLLFLIIASIVQSIRKRKG